MYLTVVKERSYIHALVLGIVLALSGCNLETVSPADDTELRYPEVPLRADQASPFNIIDHSPVEGAVRQSLLRDIRATFDLPLLSQTVTESNVRLMLNRETVPAAVVYVADTRTIRILPRQPLAPNSHYRVVLSTGLMATTGETYGGAEWRFTTAGAIGDTSQATLDACMTPEVLAMLEAVNRVRQSPRYCAGEPMAPVSPVSYQCSLASIAQSHAEDLAGQSLLSHGSSDGLQLPDRVTLEGYAWQSLGENLARTQESGIEPVMEQWLASGSHCRNLMDPEFSQIGFGHAEDLDGVRYWVQNLAEPGVGQHDGD